MDFLSTLPFIGGLLGAVGSSGSQTQTQNRDPWGPAQPYLLNNLQNLSDLQKFYQANPLSADQQRIYQSTMANNDRMQNSIGPGLLSFAGGLMGQQYQRQSGGRPGDGAGYGGQRTAVQRFNPVADYANGASGYTPAPATNFAAMNPYASFIPEMQKQRQAPQATGLLTTKPTTERGGNATRADTGWDRMSDQEKAMFLAANPMLNTINDGMNAYLDGSILSMLPNYSDTDRTWVSMAANSIGPSKDGDNPSPTARGYSPARDSQDASDAGGSKGDSGMGPGGGPAGGGLGGGQWAKGGMVNGGLLGPDPKGPDDGYGALQKGEYVIRKKAVQAIGKKKLDELNRKGGK